MPDLVPFTQFKKPKKHARRSATFSKDAGLAKVTLLHGCFSRFYIVKIVLNRATHHINTYSLQKIYIKKLKKSTRYESYQETCTVYAMNL